jgi:hypothetical protein
VPGVPVHLQVGIAPEVSHHGVTPVQAGLQVFTQTPLLLSQIEPVLQEYWPQTHLPFTQTGVVPVQVMVAQGSS